MGRSDAPPQIDVSAVKRRVSAALDTDPVERSVYMRQKICYAVAAAALAVAVTGSALAVGTHFNVLSTYFKGDTSLAQEYLDQTVYSVSDENYTLTVDNLVADKTSVYMLVTIKALNEQTQEFLFSDSFDSIDTFDFFGVSDSASEENRLYRLLNAGLSSSKKSQTEDSVTYVITCSYSDKTPADRMAFRLGYMKEKTWVELPLNPAPGVTVKIGATGVGTPDGDTPKAGQITIDQVTLSPFTCIVKVSNDSRQLGEVTMPRLMFRMSDGSLRTQAQMMDHTGGHYPDDKTARSDEYRFHEVQDLSKIKSIIVFDMEYPIDGSAPRPVAHDPALDPFKVPRMERLREGGGFSIPVRAITEGLGGSCTWDSETGDIACTYRETTVVLHPGNATVTVNGEEKELQEAPAIQNGIAVVPCDLFRDAWGIDIILTYTRGVSVPTGNGGYETFLNYGDWYVIP